MTVKRFIEFPLALVLVVPISLVLIMLYPFVVALQGRPFFYRSERMRTTDTSFGLLKIRTMRCAGDAETVLGGHNFERVTPVGRYLRKSRLDELPQIFNILAGDMGFIGPRPPLRRYVKAYPAVYKEVLRTQPGVTGLATVLIHRREDKLLKACVTSTAADRLYRSTCIAPKARLDRYYARRRSLRLDLWILFMTLRGRVPQSLPPRPNLSLRAARVRSNPSSVLSGS